MQERSSLLGKVVHQIKSQRRKRPNVVMRVYVSTALRNAYRDCYYFHSVSRSLVCHRRQFPPLATD